MPELNLNLFTALDALLVEARELRRSRDDTRLGCERWCSATRVVQLIGGSSAMALLLRFGRKGKLELKLQNHKKYRPNE
jgi:hypothetical protein